MSVTEFGDVTSCHELEVHNDEKLTVTGINLFAKVLLLLVISLYPTKVNRDITSPKIRWQGTDFPFFFFFERRFINFKFVSLLGFVEGGTRGRFKN
jgi:hypothetical protein